MARPVCKIAGANPCRSFVFAGLALAALLIPAFVSNAMGAVGPETVEECLALWESAVEDIWSYDVRLRVTHLATTDDTGQLEQIIAYSLRHRYLRGSWRVDWLADEPAEGVPHAAW